MTVVGGGDLDHPITSGRATRSATSPASFQQMTDNLRQSRAELVHVNAELAAKIGQLEPAQAQLVEPEKLASVGQMSAAVAHGLRNPLASLRASAQLALRHPDSPAARESLESMIGEVDRLDKRITHLLTFSRPAPLHPMRENLAATRGAGWCLPSIADSCTTGRSRCAPTSPSDLPEHVLDPMKVEQTMHELIANALDAMPAGGTLGLARACHADDAPDRDRGGCRHRQGHSRGASCRRCATRSSRLDRRAPGWASPSRKRFVEQNGGTLEISSTRRGTTVGIRFPVPPPAASTGDA